MDEVFKKIYELSTYCDVINSWVLYLDACSVGKTQDFINTLDNLSKSASEMKKICKFLQDSVDLQAKLL